MSGLVLTLSSDEDIRLPLARFALLQGAFYHLLSSNPDLAATLHDKPHGTDKQYKFFCFSDLHGHAHTEKTTLVFRGDVTWEVRSADERLMQAVRDTLSADPTVTLGSVRLAVTAVRDSATTVTTPTALWACDTPVLYYRTDESGRSTYFEPTDPSFCEGLANNAKRKYAAFFGEPSGDVQITLKSEPRKCVTRYRTSLITGHFATFEVTAAPSVLTFLYETGLGAKNSMGFGTVKEADGNG